jgi:hypothetical protein
VDAVSRRTLWLTGASIVAALGAAAIAAGLAFNDEGKSPLVWYGLAVVLVIVAVVIAAVGLLLPWIEARRFWNETDSLSAVAGWQADHALTPTGLHLVVAGRRETPGVPIVMCELKRYGETQARIASVGLAADASFQGGASMLDAEVLFPRDFEDEPQSFHHQKSGIYRQLWWYWEHTTALGGTQELLAVEDFRIWRKGRREPRRWKHLLKHEATAPPLPKRRKS